MSEELRPVDDSRRVQFADPERTPARHWPAGVIRQQNEYLKYLWAGQAPSEAAESAGTRLREILLWRKLDQVFDQKVRNQLQLQREEILPNLEANMYAQAQKDTVAAGRLAFDLAKVLDPETYGKKTAEITVKPAAKESGKFEMSEWFAAPTPLDAEYRSIDEPEDE